MPYVFQVQHDPNSLWMKPTLCVRSKQELVLLIILVLRGADSEDDLSKICLCVFFENTPAKIYINFVITINFLKKILILCDLNKIVSILPRFHMNLSTYKIKIKHGRDRWPNLCEIRFDCRGNKLY